ELPSVVYPGASPVDPNSWGRAPEGSRFAIIKWVDIHNSQIQFWCSLHDLREGRRIREQHRCVFGDQWRLRGRQAVPGSSEVTVHRGGALVEIDVPLKSFNPLGP